MICSERTIYCQKITKNYRKWLKKLSGKVLADQYLAKDMCHAGLPVTDNLRRAGLLLPVALQDGLCQVPERLLDEGWVRTRVPLRLVPELAPIDAVVEQLVDPAFVDGLARSYPATAGYPALGVTPS